MKMRYLRYRKFEQLRHGGKTHLWLGQQADRLGTTPEDLFNRMRDERLSFEDVQDLSPTPTEPPVGP